MMMSPEAYYDMYLSGKTKEQILSAIRSLKRENSSLKRTMEHPEYECTMHPSESVRLYCNRLYLEKAKEALSEAGGVYVPTKNELRSKEIESNIHAIKRIKFIICGLFDGCERHIIEFDDKHFHKCVSKNFTPGEAEGVESESSALITPDDSMTKEAFLEEIKELHIGEWKSYYGSHAYGCKVLDLTLWELQIEFSNGYNSLRISGQGAYPYNFDKLKALIYM